MGNSMNGCLRAAGLADSMAPRDMLDAADNPEGLDVLDEPVDLPSATPEAATTSDASSLALVVNGPSGVGKGTLIQKLRDNFPDKFGFSVSHTTRGPREGEVDGQHYHFSTHAEMEALIAGDGFVEYAHVHGNIYGTSKQAVSRVTESGKICILDIDVQGAQSVKKSGINAHYVFVKPPSFEELEHRLRGRGTESEEAIRKRLTNAYDELAFADTPNFYDTIIINSDLETAYRELCACLGLELEGSQAAPPAPAAPAPAAPAPAPAPAPAVPHTTADQAVDEWIEQDTEAAAELETEDDRIVRAAEEQAASALIRERELRESREQEASDAREKEQKAQDEMMSVQQAAIAAAIAEATASAQKALEDQTAAAAVAEAEKAKAKAEKAKAKAAEAEAAAAALASEPEPQTEGVEGQVQELTILDEMTKALENLQKEGYLMEDDVFALLDTVCDAESPEQSKLGRVYTVFHNNHDMFLRKIRQILKEGKGGGKAD